MNQEQQRVPCILSGISARPFDGVASFGALIKQNKSVRNPQNGTIYSPGKRPRQPCKPYPWQGPRLCRGQPDPATKRTRPSGHSWVPSEGKTITYGHRQASEDKLGHKARHHRRAGPHLPRDGVAQSCSREEIPHGTQLERVVARGAPGMTWQHRRACPRARRRPALQCRSNGHHHGRAYDTRSSAEHCQAPVGMHIQSCAQYHVERACNTRRARIASGPSMQVYSTKESFCKQAVRYGDFMLMFMESVSNTCPHRALRLARVDGEGSVYVLTAIVALATKHEIASREVLQDFLNLCHWDCFEPIHFPCSRKSKHLLAMSPCPLRAFA